jgi:hypothetical protein
MSRQTTLHSFRQKSKVNRIVFSYPNRLVEFLCRSLPLLQSLYRSAGIPVPSISQLLERMLPSSDSRVQAGSQLFSLPCIDPPVASAYDERMKSIPDPDTTPAEKMRAFNAGLRQILTVSKSELAIREKQYQDERATKPKRGPKPRSLASGHVSSDGD